jgi:hypothetical protein
MDPSTLTMAIDQDVMTMKARSATLVDHYILTKYTVSSTQSTLITSQISPWMS